MYLSQLSYVPEGNSGLHPRDILEKFTVKYTKRDRIDSEGYKHLCTPT